MSRVILRILVAPAPAECDIRCESVHTKAVSLAIAHVRSSRHQSICIFWLKSLRSTAAQLFPEIHMSALEKRILSRGDTHTETSALPYPRSRCKLTRLMGRQSIHDLTECSFHRKRVSWLIERLHCARIPTSWAGL